MKRKTKKNVKEPVSSPGKLLKMEDDLTVDPAESMSKSGRYAPRFSSRITKTSKSDSSTVAEKLKVSDQLPAKDFFNVNPVVEIKNGKVSPEKVYGSSDAVVTTKMNDDSSLKISMDEEVVLERICDLNSTFEVNSNKDEIVSITNNVILKSADHTDSALSNENVVKSYTDDSDSKISTIDLISLKDSSQDAKVAADVKGKKIVKASRKSRKKSIDKSNEESDDKMPKKRSKKEKIDTATVENVGLSDSVLKINLDNVKQAGTKTARTSAECKENNNDNNLTLAEEMKNLNTDSGKDEVVTNLNIKSVCSVIEGKGYDRSEKLLMSSHKSCSDENVGSSCNVISSVRPADSAECQSLSNLPVKLVNSDISTEENDKSQNGVIEELQQGKYVEVIDSVNVNSQVKDNQEFVEKVNDVRGIVAGDYDKTGGFINKTNLIEKKAEDVEVIGIESEENNDCSTNVESAIINSVFNEAGVAGENCETVESTIELKKITIYINSGVTSHSVEHEIKNDVQSQDGLWKENVSAENQYSVVKEILSNIESAEMIKVKSNMCGADKFDEVLVCKANLEAGISQTDEIKGETVKEGLADLTNKDPQNLKSSELLSQNQKVSNENKKESNNIEMVAHLNSVESETSPLNVKSCLLEPNSGLQQIDNGPGQIESGSLKVNNEQLENKPRTNEPRKLNSGSVEMESCMIELGKTDGQLDLKQLDNCLPKEASVSQQLNNGSQESQQLNNVSDRLDNNLHKPDDKQNPLDQSDCGSKNLEIQIDEQKQLDQLAFGPQELENSTREFKNSVGNLRDGLPQLQDDTNVSDSITNEEKILQVTPQEKSSEIESLDSQKVLCTDIEASPVTKNLSVLLGKCHSSLIEGSSVAQVSLISDESSKVTLEDKTNDNVLNDVVDLIDISDSQLLCGMNDDLLESETWKIPVTKIESESLGNPAIYNPSLTSKTKGMEDNVVCEIVDMEARNKQALMLNQKKAEGRSTVQGLFNQLSAINSRLMRYVSELDQVNQSTHLEHSASSLDQTNLSASSSRQAAALSYPLKQGANPSGPLKQGANPSGLLKQGANPSGLLKQGAIQSGLPMRRDSMNSSKQGINLRQNGVPDRSQVMNYGDKQNGLQKEQAGQKKSFQQPQLLRQQQHKPWNGNISMY